MVGTDVVHDPATDHAAGRTADRKGADDKDHLQYIFYLPFVLQPLQPSLLLRAFLLFGEIVILFVYFFTAALHS